MSTTLITVHSSTVLTSCMAFAGHPVHDMDVPRDAAPAEASDILRDHAATNSPVVFSRAFV